MREQDACPDCGHPWARHVRAANGAHRCTHHGCGCRDVVLPRELEPPQPQKKSPRP